MRVNKYTATLITFFLSAVVHELGKNNPFTPNILLLIQKPLPPRYYGSDLALSSYVDVIQKATWLPALFANVANTSSSIE
jgi:hypothetical protein